MQQKACPEASRPEDRNPRHAFQALGGDPRSLEADTGIVARDMRETEIEVPWNFAVAADSPVELKSSTFDSRPHRTMSWGHGLTDILTAQSSLPQASRLVSVRIAPERQLCFGTDNVVAQLGKALGELGAVRRRMPTTSVYRLERYY